MSLRARLGRLAQRTSVKAAGRFGLESYRPVRDYLDSLEHTSEYVEDMRSVRDHRPTLKVEGHGSTVTPEGLEDVLSGFPRGRRILEVGPKYGIHARWIDRTLVPSEIVFCDFASDRPLHEEWAGEIRSPHRFVYGDLRRADELLELEPFDLALFLGVLYHSVYHLPLLSRLNRVLRPGGLLVLQTTVDPRTDASIQLRWPGDTGKAKAVPTADAVRVMLAWTGFRKVTRFVDYRPGSSEILLLAEKTDELEGDEELAPVVRPHRPN